jgi:hypothetical protein
MILGLLGFLVSKIVAGVVIIVVSINKLLIRFLDFFSFLCSQP